MKKIFFCILILAFNTPSFAQLKGAPKETAFAIGPKAGVNVTNFFGDTSMMYNLFKVDFHGGIFLNFSFTDNFSVQTECVYSPKGAKFKNQTDSTDFHATYSLKYIDIPLLFQFKSADVGTNAYIQVGVQYSKLLNASYSGESTAAAQTSAFSNSNMDSLGILNKDLGLVLSVGFIGESGFCVSLRGNVGLSDIWEKDNTKVNHNAVFQFTLGFAFGRKYDVIGGKGRR